MKKDKSRQHKAAPRTYIFRAMAGKLSIASVHAPDSARATEMLEQLFTKAGNGPLLTLWEGNGKIVKRG